MSIRTKFVVSAIIFCLLACVQAAPAQRAKIRLNQDFRYLGGGQSAGYHHCSPGPNVDYYNPYSRHNSELRIGGSPQGARNYGGGYYQNSASTYADPNPAWGGDFLAPTHGVAPGGFGYDNSFDADSAIDTATPNPKVRKSALESETPQPRTRISEPVPFPAPHADPSSGQGAFSAPGSNRIQRGIWAQPASTRKHTRPIRSLGFRRGKG